MRASLAIANKNSSFLAPCLIYDILPSLFCVLEAQVGIVSSKHNSINHWSTPGKKITK
jgi:hypothetical protein